jgi:hypothetical protein
MFCGKINTSDAAGVRTSRRGSPGRLSRERATARVVRRPAITYSAAAQKSGTGLKEFLVDFSYLGQKSKKTLEMSLSPVPLGVLSAEQVVGRNVP